jgi:hypothetical protein
MVRWSVVSAVAMVAARAMAGDDPLEGTTVVSVEVGKTIERDVGLARGWFCEDPAIVKADLVTRGERNVFVATGLKVGVTRCRVGTDPGVPPWFVFGVRVVAPAKR